MIQSYNVSIVVTFSSSIKEPVISIFSFALIFVVHLCSHFLSFCVFESYICNISVGNFVFPFPF